MDNDLVSDVITSGWTSNQGLTLPDSARATHDGGLLPLFFTRKGQIIDIRMADRGNTGRYWATNAQQTGTKYAYYFILDRGAVRPSDYWSRTYGFSLRCLVSTNNR